VSATPRHGDGADGSRAPEPGPPGEPDPAAVDTVPEPVAVAPDAEAAAGSAGGVSSTIASPLEALRRDEIARTRRLVPVIFGISTSGAAALPFLAADRPGQWLFAAAILLGLFAGWWIWHHSRRPEAYSPDRVAIGWYACTLAVCLGCYHFGAFSPGPGLMVLGIYFIALGQSRIVALAVYAMCAAFQAGMSALVIAGVLRDPGLITASELTTSQQIVVQLLIQVILLASFLFARSSRRATLAAVTELERTVRALAQREALLQEARDDLDRALRSGGAGRYTDQVLGSYRLGVVIGRGAIGEVYEAAHRTSGEIAAIKLLQPRSLSDPRHLARFLREAEISSSVRSPYIARVFETGDGSGSLPYIAMERLRGRDLAQHLREHRRLPPEEVLELIAQVAAGVTAAARAGIVHRDLKPQNLFLHEGPGRARCWKILDFGVSKLGEQGGTLTQGNVVGTPGYMAPEQARGEPADHRADVYALGAIAYRAWTGHPPFAGRNTPTLLYNLVHSMPVRPGLLADVPDGVEAVLLIALSKAPADRFEAALELADALAAAARGVLPPALRARAAAVAAKQPWSETDAGRR
jgi:serine/threonine-protein kinase